MWKYMSFEISMSCVASVAKFAFKRTFIRVSSTKKILLKCFAYSKIKLSTYLWCTITASFLLNSFPHWSHLNSLKLLCVFRWFLWWVFEYIANPQMLHWYRFIRRWITLRWFIKCDLFLKLKRKNSYENKQLMINLHALTQAHIDRK